MIMIYDLDTDTMTLSYPLFENALSSRATSFSIEIKLALCKRTTQIAILAEHLFLGQNKSCEYLCTQSCFVVYHSLQRASPQVLLVVSSLTSTSSSGGPSQQPGAGTVGNRWLLLDS